MAVEQYISDDGDCDYDFESISDLLESTENITVENLRKLLVREDSRIVAWNSHITRIKKCHLD